MLEKLEGRLMWERTPVGIRVEIPARLDWAVVVLGVILTVWALLGMSVAPLEVLTHDAPGFAAWFFWLCFLVLACAAAILLAWNFKGRTTLTLDPAEMKLVHSVFGVEWNKRVFPDPRSAQPALLAILRIQARQDVHPQRLLLRGRRQDTCICVRHNRHRGLRAD